MNVLAFIMAGGKGSRLRPLTNNRAKPAVHFGAKYRIIDFVINNFINSGFYKIKVLTQYKSSSLNSHIYRAFNLNRNFNMFVDVVPAQMRKGEVWYRGTADAVGQNINEIYDYEPDYTAVFGGDHIYKMDVRQMLKFHIKKKAFATISVIPVPKEEAKEFGVVEVDEDYRIIDFVEKPENPPVMPDNPDYSLVSMGNYFFTTDFLKKLIYEFVDGQNMYDFGYDIFPNIIKDYPVYAYDFSTNKIDGETTTFWKDVGNVDSYYEANMDLLCPVPSINLYNRNWPIRTTDPQLPPAKFVIGSNNKIGNAINSLIGEGVIISGAQVCNSIIFKNVFVDSDANIEDSIVLPDCKIGRGVKLKKVIVERNLTIPDGIEIGFNLEKDKQYFTVTPNGVVVIPQDFDWSSYS